jgi:two-component system cell cycle response regulator DivK
MGLLSEGGHRGMRATILYVEDNYDNRMLVRRVLEAEGYRVIEAEDGVQGIEWLLSQTPDLVLMDINLPEIDGYEVTKRFKQLPSMDKVPVIAMTAIPKPIDIDALPDQIARFLGKKK